MSGENDRSLSGLLDLLHQKRLYMMALVLWFAILILLPLPAWLELLLAFGAAIWVCFRSPQNKTQDSKPLAASDMPALLQNVTAEKLADLLADPLIIFDEKGIIVYANKAASQAFSQLEIGTILHLRFRAPEIHSLFQAVLKDGHERSIDYFERLPVERWYQATVKGLANGLGDDLANGLANGLVGRSISDNLFMLVFKDQSAAKRIDRMRSDFIANASHELRTPLASLRGFIETLQGPARNDEAARSRFLEIMARQADRMSRLIDDLLSLSRLEMQAHLEVSDKVDLTAVLDHVADALTPVAQDVQVEIIRDIPEKPVNVRGSRDELIQVFQNLVENACKYGQSGEKVEIRLKTTIENDKKIAIIDVQDYGAGIAREDLPRLTERFYRSNTDTAQLHKGTGLGLAIVKHILTRHRGRMLVRSKLGKGATFTIKIPVLDEST